MFYRQTRDNTARHRDIIATMRLLTEEIHNIQETLNAKATAVEDSNETRLVGNQKGKEVRRTYVARGVKKGS